MNETPDHSQENGPLTVDQAANLFETMESEEDNPRAKEDDEKESEPEPKQEVEAEDEPADEEESDEETEKPVLHTVKVDGKKIQVPLDELLSGYSRTADYMKKTQALADQRRTAEAEFEAVKSERAHYAQTLGQLQAQIQATEPKIDWATLEAENPAEWTRQRFLQQDRFQRQSMIAAEQQKVAETNQAEADKIHEVRMKEESAKLLDVVPEWKDAKVASAEKTKLVDFLQDQGFTTEQISEASDHRLVKLLRDAMLYRDVRAKRAELRAVPVQATVKPAVPGTSQSSKTSNAKRDSERLAKSGSIHDAAAIFERYMST